MLLECPITIDLFQKKGYDFNDCNNVTDILYNSVIIISVVKMIVHSHMGKLVQNIFIFFFFFLGGGGSSITSM